ncbi:hypothetical protein, partial [Cohnella rhizosphaerae]
DANLFYHHLPVLPPATGTHRDDVFTILERFSDRSFTLYSPANKPDDAHLWVQAGADDRLGTKFSP